MVHKYKPYSVVLLSLLGIFSSTTVLALPYPDHETLGVSLHPRNGGHSLETRNITTVSLNRRDSTKCSDLSVEQAKQMPGWDKLEKYAKDTWGDGGWNIVTNPKEYPDRWASACIGDDPVAIVPKGKPQCQTHLDTLQGTAAGTNGSAMIKITTGEATTGGWTVTRASEFGYEVKFESKFEIPGLVEAGASTSTTGKFTNSRGDTFTTTVNSQHETQITGNAPDGSKCDVQLQVKSCNQKGEGRIRIAATGYVWFNYDSKRAPKAGPKDDKHYKYAANIEDVLSLDERTSWMEFDGSISGESKGHYKLACDKNGQKSIKAIGKPAPGSKAVAPPKKGEKKPAPKKGEKKPVPKKDEKKPAPKKDDKKAVPNTAQKKVDKKPAPKPAQKPAPSPKKNGKK